MRCKCKLTIKPNKDSHKTKSKGCDKTTPFIYRTVIKSVMSARTSTENQPTKEAAEMKLFYTWNNISHFVIIFNAYAMSIVFANSKQSFLNGTLSLFSHSPGVPHNIRSVSQRIGTKAGFAGMQTRVFILSPRLQGSRIRGAEYAICW